MNKKSKAIKTNSKKLERKQDLNKIENIEKKIEEVLRNSKELKIKKIIVKCDIWQMLKLG